MALAIRPLGRSRGERVRFWRAGLAPYRGDPHFVTPLLKDCLARWAPGGALFEHAETCHFVAVRDGRDVGRVAATVDSEQDRVHGDRTGNFGWYECEDRPETSRALLDAAAAWLSARGRTRVRGPLSYTTNGVSGLLVEDHRPGPPLIDMPYNPPWYAAQLTDFGLTAAKDLIAYWAPARGERSDRMARVAARVLERGGLTVRCVRTSRAGFREDVDHVLRIYNQAWEANWGFVPMTEAEIREQAAAFRPILDPDFLLFAEHRGVPVGLALALPDVNQALATIRGRLWPWSVVRLLLAMRRIDRVRVPLVGVLPQWHRKGLEAALIQGLVDRARDRGHTGGECSWILEDNRAIIAGLERIGGEPYRRYRLYEKDL